MFNSFCYEGLTLLGEMAIVYGASRELRGYLVLESRWSFEVLHYSLLKPPYDGTMSLALRLEWVRLPLALHPASNLP